jgi:hypothetical protein
VVRRFALTRTNSTKGWVSAPEFSEVVTDFLAYKKIPSLDAHSILDRVMASYDDQGTG